MHLLDINPAGMNLLDRYIVRNFILGMIPVLLLLLLLFSFMALAEELEDVGKGAFTQFDAYLVVLYTAPRRVIDLLPVTSLLGGLMGLGILANHQELMAASVGGMSRLRLARPVLILALLMALLTVLAQCYVVPVSEQKANELRARTLVATRVDALGDAGFWTRTGSEFVHVTKVRYGRLLSGIEIYSIDAHGRFVRLIQAGQASAADRGDWLLNDVTVTSIDGHSVESEQLETLRWPALLSPQQVATLILPLEALAPSDLWRLVDFQRDNGLDTHRYRVVLWQQLSIAVAVIGMALLALPMLQGSIRAIPASQRVVMGGFIGIGFYLLQQLSGHVAGLLKWNPPSVIMTPALLILAVAVYAQFLDVHRKQAAQRRARTRA
jgi:lipopolysaccharide export system permease protein